MLQWNQSHNSLYRRNLNGAYQTFGYQTFCIIRPSLWSGHSSSVISLAISENPFLTRNIFVFLCSWCIPQFVNFSYLSSFIYLCCPWCLSSDANIALWLNGLVLSYFSVMAEDFFPFFISHTYVADQTIIHLNQTIESIAL